MFATFLHLNPEWALTGFMILCGTMIIVKTPKHLLRSKWHEIWPAEAFMIGMACNFASENVPVTIHPAGLGTVLHLAGSCCGIAGSIVFCVANWTKKRPVRQG